ncbi:MAG: cytochrome P460 family protein [Chloroflexi bacterium]|nr:cytochrome P460 family protein [Chloroflexota bacterium]
MRQIVVAVLFFLAACSQAGAPTPAVPAVTPPAAVTPPTAAFGAATATAVAPASAPAKPRAAWPSGTPAVESSPTAPAKPSGGPSPTPGPAPTEDRVGFPDGYQTSFTPFYVFDRPDNKQARVVYANGQAAQAKAGEPFPYGSVIVMETHRAKVDGPGNPVLDANGRYVRDQLAGIFVMRKEPGFGSAYQGDRTGEWEYVAYRADKTYLSPPRNSNACAKCHVDAGPESDWVYRSNLYFDKASGALPAAAPGRAADKPTMRSYLFLPARTTVKTGTPVTWTNDDRVIHNVTASDGSYFSGPMKPGGTFSRTFDRPGTYEYLCSLHPASMRAQIVVEN